MIDLEDKYLTMVKNILAEIVPNAEVRAYGSRVDHTAKKYSDLDITIIAKEKLSFETLAKLQEAYAESDIPIIVDVHDWNGTSAEFRKVIEENYIVVQEAKNI